MARKKSIMVLALCALAFALLSQISFSYYYSISHHCPNDTCIEGEDAKWEVYIVNDGKHDVSFTTIKLVDAKNNTPFAVEKRRYFPQRDDRGDLIEVTQARDAKINVTGGVPAANSGKNHTYYACFTLAIYDFYTIARDDKYEEEQCFSKNETMEISQCTSNSHCEEGQFCRGNKCINLKCKECQYIDNHSCKSYQCCENGHCQDAESCANNTCVRLGCEYNQYSFNHTCTTLECSFDEHISNRSCKKLDCGFNEFALNHTCSSLYCKEDEFTYNHTCKKLNCLPDEMIKDHLCIPLECGEDEFVYNHTCKELDCWFFQDSIGHACANNKNAVTKILLEVIAVAVIVSFLLLDFSKFESMHLRKKQSEDKK